MNLNGGPTRVVFVEEGGDYFLDDNQELPYSLVKNLGHGHSANVEMIRDNFTGSTFARKVFRISGSKDMRRRIFENEIKIIQRLEKHHHIIRVYATYMSRRETGLILSPVASQGDLETYLQDFRDGECTETGMYTLISAFGCLASGLLFMHTQHVRHKDIKPRNILIHNNSVIYTDFGYSLDHSTATGSTTTGRPDTLTRKYCAPEVQGWEPRNAKSDVFSLGCVFFEIFASLGFCDLPESSVPYHQRIDEVKILVQSSFGPVNEWFRAMGDLTCVMLDISPDKRPPALHIVKELWAHYRGHFCPQCRHSLPEQGHDDFPPQPLDEFYELRRTNFTTGWITSEEMISGGTLLDHISSEANSDQQPWTPVQHPQTPLSRTTSALNGDDRSVSRNPVANSPQTPSAANSPRPVYYPATPDLSLLKRSSTIVHDKLPTPRASASPPPTNLRSMLPNNEAPSSPLITRAATAIFENSPKTYAMALAGDRDRTPVANLPQRLTCPYNDCYEMFISELDRQKHLAKPSLPYTCTVPGCDRSKHGFATMVGLESHIDTLHVMGSTAQSFYQCSIQDCSKKDRIWTRLEDVRRHVLGAHHLVDKDRDVLHMRSIGQSKVSNHPRRTSATVIK